MNPLRRLDLRPLDPVRSIKMKLGLLVVASVSIGATVTWYGLVILGLLPRFISSSIVPQQWLSFTIVPFPK